MLLFPLGVRVSTWLTVAAFSGVAVVRRDRLPLVACWAWLAGFEAAFQIADLALGRLSSNLFQPIFFLTLAAATLPLTIKAGARPSRLLFVLALAVFAIWAALGLPANGHQSGMFTLHPTLTHFQLVGELLNDAAKTLLAAAYLAPLVRGSGELVPGADGEWAAGNAAAADLRA